MRILQGPLRGARWITTSGTHGCWLGTYELAKQRRLCELLQPGDTFYDIGAHAGLYTLLAARLVGASGHVVAFEPDPRNFANLEMHVMLNGLRNVRPIRAAIAATTRTASVLPAASSYETRLGSGEGIAVQCYSLDDAIARLALPRPHVLKIDVEGAEEAVIEGAENALKLAQPVILLATHGTAVHERCCLRLIGLRYSVRALDGGPWQGSDEIIAVPPSN